MTVVPGQPGRGRREFAQTDAQDAILQQGQGWARQWHPGGPGGLPTPSLSGAQVEGRSTRSVPSPGCLGPWAVLPVHGLVSAHG